MPGFYLSENWWCGFHCSFSSSSLPLLPSFPLSLTSHSLSFSFLCAFQIRCQSISTRGEVKEHRTFVLKLALFFLFSFIHLVLLLVFLYSISDWFTLIHFLLFLLPSLTSLSHTRARTRERTLILHWYILLWNESTVRLPIGITLHK